MVIIQQETYQIIYTKKTITNLLARQTNMNIFEQINFTGKLDKDDDAAIFFITDKQQKSFLQIH